MAYNVEAKNEALESVIGKEVNDFKELIKEGFGFDLPTPYLLQSYRDLANRTIYITDEINEDLIDYEKLIIRWNQEDRNIPVEERDPIKIFIYSYGGDCNACFSFIDVMRLSKTPIKIICAGVAMSSAALIYICAPRGSRYITKNSTILIHQGNGGAGGTAQMVLDQTENYKWLLQTAKNLILENTNISKQTYTKMSKNEWYIYSDKAIELGIADHIITDLDEFFN